ncbi:hypothetical protein [Eubacterium ruminantium]|uniref:hypothetical protein n=1 Tax=Eubacterium ruminantium TaxID=42322 RepID=UPI0024797DA5|nr:hypothetical protein [Eubacterium ruminantium]
MRKKDLRKRVLTGTVAAATVIGSVFGNSVSTVHAEEAEVATEETAAEEATNESGEEDEEVYTASEQQSEDSINDETIIETSEENAQEEADQTENEDVAENDSDFVYMEESSEMIDIPSVSDSTEEKKADSDSKNENEENIKETENTDDNLSGVRKGGEPVKATDIQIDDEAEVDTRNTITANLVWVNKRPFPNVGDVAELRVDTIGGNNLKYQWMYSKDGGATWDYSTCQGNKTNSIKVIVKCAYDKEIKYRCKVYNSNEAVYTSGMSISGSSLIGGGATYGIERPSGVKSQIKLEVDVPEETKYEWQVSKDDGKTWKKSKYKPVLEEDTIFGGDALCCIEYVMRTDMDGWEYRLKATRNGVTEYSKPYKLKLLKRKILGTGAEFYGDYISLSIDGSYGDEFSHVIWQYFDGKKWVNSKIKPDFDNGHTIEILATSKNNGKKYRAVVVMKNGTKHYDAEAYTLKTKSNVISQPVSKTTQAGKTVNFSVKVGGREAKCQWQVSKDNGKTWVNSNAAYNKDTKVSIKAEKRMNGFLYRCAVKNGDVTTYSKPAKLTVK